MSDSGDRIIERILLLNTELQMAGCEPLKEVWVGRKAYDTIALSLLQGRVLSQSCEDPRGQYNHGLIRINGTKVRMDEP